MKEPRDLVDAREFCRDLLPAGIAGEPPKADASLRRRVIMFSKANFATALRVEEINKFVSAWEMDAVPDSGKVFEKMVASYKAASAKHVAERCGS